jgi:hypothetical protein
VRTGYAAPVHACSGKWALPQVAVAAGLHQCQTHVQPGGFIAKRALETFTAQVLWAPPLPRPPPAACGSFLAASATSSAASLASVISLSLVPVLSRPLVVPGLSTLVVRESAMEVPSCCTFSAAREESTGRFGTCKRGWDRDCNCRARVNYTRTSVRCSGPWQQCLSVLEAMSISCE